MLHDDHLRDLTPGMTPAPPFGTTHLPSYPTIVYFEKLGVLILTAVAVVWVLVHLVAGKPGRAAAIASGRAG